MAVQNQYKKQPVTSGQWPPLSTLDPRGGCLAWDGSGRQPRAGLGRDGWETLGGSAPPQHGRKTKTSKGCAICLKVKGAFLHFLARSAGSLFFFAIFETWQGEESDPPHHLKPKGLPIHPRGQVLETAEENFAHQKVVTAG